jgi:hypothetical protein
MEIMLLLAVGVGLLTFLRCNSLNFGSSSLGFAFEDQRR